MIMYEYVKLRNYLKFNKIKTTEFAKAVDVKRPYLSRLLHGHKKPSKRLARDIEIATNGEIKATELILLEGKEIVEKNDIQLTFPFTDNISKDYESDQVVKENVV